MRRFAALGALILAWPTIALTLVLTLALTLGPTPARAESRLPGPRDLASEASSNAREGRALLVLFSQHGCPWCERVRREFLLPIQNNEDYRLRIALRQIDIDRNTALRDFAGRATTHAAFARAQGVRLYPTVMLFGPAGERLADPLVGFTGSDYYGAHLDQRIDQAEGKMRQK